MKKCTTLLLATALVFCAATGAYAIDFKAKGEWIMSFDYGQGGALQSRQRSDGRPDSGKKVSGFNGQSDQFNAMQRVRLQLDAVASEALSGTVFFEIGEQTWGKAADGGALGADGTVVGVKRAYIDWTVPQTALTVRMGLQNIALPAFTNGASQVFDADLAAVTLSYKFNDNVSATLAWGRPYNDNFANTSGHGDPSNMLDNIDAFALLVPMQFDGFAMTPWVIYTAMGKNSLAPGDSLGSFYNTYVGPGVQPAVFSNKLSDKAYAYGTGVWAGLTGEITAADPFRFAWDANYGSVATGIEAQKREGYYVSVLGEYKMDWATPGLYAWYASGDDGNVKNGSERMPYIAPDGDDGFSSFGSSGNPYIGRDNVLSTQYTGTWGIGARLKSMTFVEDLKHTFRVNYLQGTNSPTMAKRILQKDVPNIEGRNYARMYHDFNDGAYGFPQPVYMTTRDSALEFGLSTTYQIYENLTLFADMSYIAMFMDQSDSVWGKGKDVLSGNAYSNFKATDPWNINVSFVYDF